MAKDSMSLPMAIRKYLSLPGETPTDLMKQIRALSEKDKDDLTGYFNAQGIQVERTVGTAPVGG